MADPSRGGDMVVREYSKGNWTVSETLVLIEAKKMDEERRVRRSTTGLTPEKRPEIRNRPASELRWKWIEEYCWRKGCLRNQNQCNDKWDNLMRDYKKIREYERWRVEPSFTTGSSSSAAASSPSYWQMEKSERKEKNLPSNMLPQIYEALAELVDKKSLPSSSSPAAAAGNGHGGSSGVQIVRVCQQNLGFVAPVTAQPMHQLPATIVLTLPQPQPPPPQPLVLSHPPPPPPLPSTFHAEPIQPTVDTSSRAKRRRTKPGETNGGGGKEAEEVAVGAALSRSASLIAQVMRESEERQERRHKEVVRLKERRLEIEETKAEINRQGMSGLVDAINKLATSILALVSSSSSCHNNQNHQEGAP
ncbi:unnamed protein product [Microthlaspi erraticum]|uniref:Myb-like domain-containing protein n=1 Tax=Microthlaspi erraticum TaxID=1685480 RepID=A0A6D2HVT2_9BRAS|nr:unnamed protein product [Microthlaspi erraticum]